MGRDHAIIYQNVNNKLASSVDRCICALLLISSLRNQYAISGESGYFQFLAFLVFTQANATRVALQYISATQELFFIGIAA